MNSVEICEAVEQLAKRPFDAETFPYAFLEAFGNKETTIKRLKSGSSNKSDLGGVLQTNNIHIKVCDHGKVTETLIALKESAATTKAKAKFVLATDGISFEAEELTTGEVVVCDYPAFAHHFGFFLALAGISTVKAIRENSFDIRATSKLNKLYIELLKENPEWGTSERRPAMNHFMARLIFCFFAEDTDIFSKKDLFTGTVEQMSDRDSSNTHEIIAGIFRAMNVKTDARVEASIATWANEFPYVNGGLFSGALDVPCFSKHARSLLIHVGNLDWTQINPDIFGSMIQAVADDDERGALGMHYTSVPNILKVLNPLFLDDLKAQLEAAGDNGRKLLNLRSRIAKIRVFDPACGSGNFLVIAYKEMRAIEAEINKRRGEADRRTEIPLTNFRGIELRDFPAEIARLALIIAEYQCDVRYRGQKEALAALLPLDAKNWITCGNALRLDWLSICPPTGTGVKHRSDDLFGTELEQPEIDFENEGGETYICGNPPYVGATVKAPKGASKELKKRLKHEAEERKADLKLIFAHRTSTWKSLDYVAGWFMKAAEYGIKTETKAAFVATNSVCQGQHVAALWPLIFDTHHQITFAHTSFKWTNLAARNAGVTVVIVGLSSIAQSKRYLYGIDKDDVTSVKEVEHINAYLVPITDVIVTKRTEPLGQTHSMTKGSAPTDGGHLLFSREVTGSLLLTKTQHLKYIRKFIGSEDAINGTRRFCLWLHKQDAEELSTNEKIEACLNGVKQMRLESDKKQTRELAKTPWIFGEKRQEGNELPFVIPRVSSENREYLPFIIGNKGDIISDSAFAIYDAPLWNMALIASSLHAIWIRTVCGQLETRLRYSNTLGWNTFPVPKLTEKNKADLTRCAEDILLAREAHFPATIADLYDPETMPENLRAAHERNDETLERIYIGRRFKNDTERLEKLFELYTKMTAERETHTKPNRGAQS